MASNLPIFPWFVFTIVEPISTFAGFLGPVLDPAFFVSSQIAHEPPHPLFPSEHILALQLGNTYLLASLIGLFVLNTTSEIKTVNAYLVALAIADVSHVSFSAWAMGWDEVVDVKNWNSLAWGNIGFTIFLFITRISYFIGLFGKSARNGGLVSKKKQ